MGAGDAREKVWGGTVADGNVKTEKRAEVSVFGVVGSGQTEVHDVTAGRSISGRMEGVGAPFDEERQ